jgi:tRNA(Ile)-lysidine synthase
MFPKKPPSDPYGKKGKKKPEAESKLRSAIRAAGEKQGWWDARGLLVALSGGGDSMATFELLRRFFPGRIAAAHLEHGLRGETSVADADFVASYCEKHGVECFVRHGDVNKNRLPGESSEMAGRRLRYEFFFEILDHEGLQFVATGHNRDDSVETMLFRLFRGTGMRGLAGITPRRGRVVRPVIGLSRKELRGFLMESGVPWREDETNEEDSYQRNRIRNHLLPWIRENINASPEGLLLGLSEECALADAESERIAESLLSWISRSRPPALACWDTALARSMPRARLAEMIRAQGRRLGLPLLERRRVRELCGLFERGGRWRFQWAGSIEVCGASGEIGWIDRSLFCPPNEITARIECGESKILDWGAWRIEAALAKNSGEPPRSGPRSARLPADSPCVLSISSVLETDCRILREIPWWHEAAAPILSWRHEDRLIRWMPEALESMHNAGSYDIIVRVFCREEQSQEGVQGYGGNERFI